MQAVILAAGEGTRVRPLTRSRPKAMIPVANRPMIDYVIESLTANGIRDIVVVVGYRREQVIRHLNQLEVPVRVVVQDRQLGTAHALSCAHDEISEEFILIPGDNYVDPESIARIRDLPDSMLVAEHPNPSEFGVVLIDEGRAVEVIEKPEISPAFTVSTGIFHLRPSVFSSLVEPDLTDTVAGMIREGCRLRALHAHRWQDAIYPWDYLRLNARLLEGVAPRKSGTLSPTAVIRGPVSIGEGAEIGPHASITGPVVIGEDAVIGPHTVVGPGTSIGARSLVEPFSYLGNSLIMDDAWIGSHSRITGTVMAEGCALADHTSVVPAGRLVETERGPVSAEFGAVLGQGVRSAPFTVFSACIAGNKTEIRRGRTLRETLEDGTLVM